MTARSDRAVVRFAPSPNGELHLGHALSALVGWTWAQKLGGRFLLRIEDIDVARCRQAHVQGIFDDLRWLGLTWPEPVLRQSEHFPRYATAAQGLMEARLLYPCFATRAEIAEAARERPGLVDPDGAPLYPGLHRSLAVADVAERVGRGEPFALRLDMERALARARDLLAGEPLTYTAIDGQGRAACMMARPERWGDAVIVRKDVPASYHLAVVLDDAMQGVTHVTRGKDLEAATDLHRLLQVLLGLPAPLYHHHALITDEDGRKLSKSARDTSIGSARGQGATPGAIRQRLAPYLAEYSALNGFH